MANKNINDHVKPCGAKLRNKDAHCRAPAMANGRCRIHGGKSPRGVDGARYVHGRYSRYAPTKLSQRIDAAENDPDLISNRAELALLTVRAQELLQKAANDGDSSDAWEELYNVLDLRRRVNDTERRRLVDLNQMVPVEQVYVLLGQIYDVIQEHVTDRRILAAIGESFRALTGADGVRQSLPAERRRAAHFTPVSDVPAMAP